MKTILALVVLVVVVSAKPEQKSLEQRIDASFSHYLNVEKKDVIYPAGFKDKICNDKDCCTSHSCPAWANCQDLTNAGGDAVNAYGYSCYGAKCGTNKEYVGTFCDVPADKACDICKSKHGKDKVSICYASMAVRYGYVCLQKLKGGDYEALDRRDFDVMYGEGTAARLERIAKEEADAMVEDKSQLTELLRELISELDN